MKACSRMSDDLLHEVHTALEEEPDTQDTQKVAYICGGCLRALVEELIERRAGLAPGSLRPLGATVN